MSRFCGWAFLGISLLGFLVVAVMISGLSPVLHVSLPVSASSDAVSVDRQLSVLFVIVGCIFVGASATFVWVALGPRRLPQRAADSPNDAKFARSGWVPILLGMAVLAVAEGSGWFFAVPSARAVVPASRQDESVDIWAKLRIRAYECQVTYPGADQRLGTLDDVRVAGQLQIPLDGQVTIQLEADDGPHRWYVPALRRRVDLSSGAVVQLPIRVDSAGVYDMIVIDLSGHREDAVPGRLVVQPDGDVRKWIDDEARSQQRQQTPHTQEQP